MILGISVNINLCTAGSDEYSSSSRKEGAQNNIRAQEILVVSACLGCLLPVSHEQDAEALSFLSLVKNAGPKSVGVPIITQDGMAETAKTATTHFTRTKTYIKEIGWHLGGCSHYALFLSCGDWEDRICSMYGALFQISAIFFRNSLLKLYVLKKNRVTTTMKTF